VDTPTSAPGTAPGAVPGAAPGAAPGFAPAPAIAGPSLRVRADAQRNRDRLIQVARGALAAEDGAVSLEAIARDAGVGIGTLYRHFPTRDALVEAVYRTELEAVLAKADELLAGHAPDVALRLWMNEYAHFVTTKRGMAESLRGLRQAGSISSSQTRPLVTAAVRELHEAGVRAGSLRADVRSDDIVASLVGIFLATPDASDGEQTRRMLDLLFAGIVTTRPR
jgi:AcrR family transcriptional regulator